MRARHPARRGEAVHSIPPGGAARAHRQVARAGTTDAIQGFPAMMSPMFLFDRDAVRRAGRRLAGALALAGLVVLAGCASTLDARVSSFHQWTADLRGASFEFRPTPAQRDSLEYRHFEDLVRRALIAQGLREGSPPRLAVTFDYGVTEATRTQLRSAPVFYPYLGFGYGWGGWRGGYGGLGWGWPGPAYVDVPYAEKVAQHRLRLQIDRAVGGAAPGATGTGPRLFEGVATADASVVDMPAIFPLLVQALFEDFPGPAGATREVRVEIPRR